MRDLAGDKLARHLGEAVRAMWVVEGVRVVGGAVERMMEMAAIRALIGVGLGHKRRAVAVLERDLLDSVLEREGRIGGGDVPGWREIDLLLAGSILGIRGDDIDVDRQKIADDLADEG